MLFLQHTGPAYPYVVGLSQGAFRVVADARTGQRMVTTPIVMGKGGDEPERVVRGDVTRRPLPIDAFRDAVRQVIAQGGGAVTPTVDGLRRHAGRGRRRWRRRRTPT